MSAPFEARLAALRHACAAAPAVQVEGEARVTLFLSWSDGTRRARVVAAQAASIDPAWREAIARLAQPSGAIRWLRADWVTACDPTDWRDLRARLARTKRNYFRLGVALDPRFEHAFLETEINANAMFHGGRAEPCAALNPGNFASYARRKYGLEALDLADDTPVWTFATAGAFVGADGVVNALEPTGRNAGRRRSGPLTPAGLDGLIARGSRYLAAQVGGDGRFHYGWHPCFDRPIAAYNALRHASSVYAMLEAWAVTRESVLLAAIHRALNYLTGTLIRSATLADGTPAAFLVEADGEAKLGGGGVCLLALCKHAELTGSSAYRTLLDRLAAGILAMQRPDGGFVHVLDYPALAVRDPFRIIYYDGEAAFGLMRLYDLTGDARWLRAVERAFDHFVAAGHARAHDHWLAYAAAALTRHRPDARWFKFALDNVSDHLDFVEHRITTFPTLLELMMASQQVIARLSDDPDHAGLLDGFDRERFDRALHARAHYLLNGHFWPELAMFFARPDRIEGSFFIRHHGFRVRIDDVEHYLSGLIAYRGWLAARVRPPAGWTANSVAAATGGDWTRAPAPAWRAGGLATHPGAFRPGDMVVARASDGGSGMSAAAIATLPTRPAAILTATPERFADGAIPVLRIARTDVAIHALGEHARARLQGRVIAVTGSVGKTTLVAMLAAALEPHGSVAQTRANANLPNGVAWNLASIPADTAHAVLELAIGRMRRNTALARPDIAIFTDIAPAHLDHHADLPTIARRKARIFEGMAAGGLAILNLDMPQVERVAAMAAVRGLRIAFYGTARAAAYRLAHYDPSSGHAVAQTPAGEYRYRLAPGCAHLARNSVAALAAIDLLGLDPAASLERLARFEPPAGRGNIFDLTLGERRLTIIDQSYNANPASMAAALLQLDAAPARRRIAVLGEMLELGPDRAAYHDALAAGIAASRIDEVHTLGDLYLGMRAALPPARRGVHATMLVDLDTALAPRLRDGDAVLVKGSHGGGIHGLIAMLRRRACADAHVERRARVA